MAIPGYYAEMRSVTNWRRYDYCDLCFSPKGEPCRPQYHYGEKKKLADIGYCVTPHRGRALVTGIRDSFIFGTTVQPIDVQCDNVTDNGCGAEPGEKCHDKDGHNGDYDWFHAAIVHNARYRRLMRVKLMWRAWN